MECEVRVASEDDAVDISRVIIAALRETNARDYPESVIERVEQSFGPDAVREFIGKRRAFVAVTMGRIVGTASLDGGWVRTVFVEPSVQGKGVGRLLMDRVERAAREAGLQTVNVPSSVTAEPFYAQLGFKAVRDSYHGEERTIIMERSLVS